MSKISDHLHSDDLGPGPHPHKPAVEHTASATTEDSLDDLILLWLNARYRICSRKPESASAGNCGVIYVLSNARGYPDATLFNAEDLTRCVSSLATKDRLGNGYGITHANCEPCATTACIRDLAIGWMFGLHS